MSIDTLAAPGGAHASVGASPYPADRLAESFTKRLSSRDGEAGIVALVERVQPKWGDLETAWTRRGTPGGPEAFGSTLYKAVRAVDSEDLVAIDIPLRATVWGSDFFDLNVCAKIGHAVLEVLADGYQEEVLRAALAISPPGTIPGGRDGRFLANAILVPLFLEHDEFDAAISAAKRNLVVGCDPAVQYSLYQSLLAKKQAGHEVSKTETYIDDLSDRFCSQPFDTLATQSRGRREMGLRFYACQCPGTLPYPVANSEGTIEEIWNGPAIQEVRRSILDGDFTYCSRMMCPELTHGKLPKRDEITDPRLRDIIDNHRTEIEGRPQMITLGHDPSCNLACPSCRCEVLAIKNKEREVLDEVSDRILLPLMEDTPLSLIVCTDGDPFGSKHYRKLIHSLDPVRHSKARLMLITNGLLFTPREWESLGEVQKLLAFVGVSIDGARPETYEDLRRPGKWGTISENMAFMSELRRSGKLPMLGLQFVVQKTNFEEMIEFVELGKKWGADIIRFIRLVNIGSYTGESFEENDVSDPRHPLYPRLLEVLRNPVLHEPPVDMFTLAPLQGLADAS